MNKSQKTWLGICLIVLAIIFLGGWIYLAATIKFDQLHNLFLQLFLMLVGAAGSFLLGQVVSERQSREQVRTRYRRLRGVFLYMYDTSQRLNSLDPLPHLNYSQENARLFEQYRTVVLDVGGQIRVCTAAIRDCLDTWHDSAPEAVNDLHQETFLEK